MEVARRCPVLFDVPSFRRRTPCLRPNRWPAQKKAMVEKHVGLIRQAAGEGAQIVCLQEIFNGPYFCAEQADELV